MHPTQPGGPNTTGAKAVSGRFRRTRKFSALIGSPFIPNPAAPLAAAAVTLAAVSLTTLPACSEVAGAAASSNATANAQPPARPEPVYRAGVREIPDKPEHAVRLVAYNVLNLFDDHDDPALSGDVDDMHNSRRGLRAKPAQQNAAVAQAIRDLDADIIALQEVESLDALTEFRDTHLADMGYKYIASEDVGYGRGVEQSVLSRFPITDTRTWPQMPLDGKHPDDPARMSRWDRDSAGKQIVFRRSPLYTQISIPAAPGEDGNADGNYELGIFNIHHKSGRNNDYWRLAEAKAITKLINETARADRHLNIAALGDFNDTTGAEHVILYSTASGMTDALAATRGPVNADAAFTHASSRTIDFIMVNKQMLPEIVIENAFVYATPLRPRDADWRNTPTPEGYASDHMPVVIDFIPRDR